VIAGELRFTKEDMALFAAASGDRSALHTDPAFARRTAFGACIVYGGLLSIGMLGLLPAEALARVRTVRSSFPGPVLPGVTSTARAQSRPGSPDEWEVRLIGRGKTVARIRTSADEDPSIGAERGGVSAGAGSLSGHPAWGEIEAEYRVGPELAELARRFDLESLDPKVLEGIAWASNVVGTTIPDFDGLCAAVTIVAAGPEHDGGTAARQWVRPREYDERTDRLLIDGVVSDQANIARCRGLIECFPFSPTPLPDAAGLTSIGPIEPSRGTVVVVGGSRGFGAALALSLLARGYVVHVLYASSSAQAGELSRLAGPYAARLLLHQLDAGGHEAVSRVAGAVGASIDGLALCAAPPPLPMALTGQSAGELADFVAQSVNLAAVPIGSFLPLLRRDGGWVLICSASAVVDPPRELPQLTAAKAALEGLARWVATTTPSARIVLARPPTMRTDLVNTPNARAGAAEPQAVAASIVERLLDDELVPGLSILEPEPVAASAR
jgi:NAD(P)-dependent dehydrogenase (short-subunit alcohol dehydrogenase family)/acyl dehydratase